MVTEMTPQDRTKRAEEEHKPHEQGLVDSDRTERMEPVCRAGHKTVR